MLAYIEKFLQNPSSLLLEIENKIDKLKWIPRGIFK